VSLRARIVTEETAPQTQEGHLVAVYRAKLLQEIDLAEMSAATSSAARARCCRPPSGPR
jgi:pilus assembly protein CpaF